MSSKFRDLLTQARNRSSEEEEGREDATNTQESEPEQTEDEGTSSSPETHPSLEKEEDAAFAIEDDSGAKRGRPRNGKRSDPLFTQITAYISKKTHQEVKVALLHEGEGRQMSELVEECLRLWLEECK